MRKIFSILIIALLVTMLVSCSSGGSSSCGESPYSSENGKLSVQNGLSTGVVLFKNEIRETSRIDCIDALETNTYDLREDGFTVLMAVLRSDYDSKPINSLEPVFTELFYYNKMGEMYNTTIVDNPFPSGDSEVTFDNRSKYWVELHKGSEKGEILTVLPPESIEVLDLAPGEYDVFPVFVYLMKTGMDEKILGMERLVLEEGIWTRRYDSGKQYFEKIAGAELDNLIQYNKGYLSVVNNSDDGFRVMNGNTRLVTGTNLSLINPGERLVFEIEQVGETWKQLNISSKRLDRIELPDITFEKGKVYEVEINDVYEPVLKDEAGIDVKDFKENIGH